MKNISIKRDFSIKVNSRVTSLLRPIEVFLPYDTSILLKKKEVKKGELLYDINGKRVFSPISGTIKEVVKDKNNNTYLVIENNYKEELIRKKKLNFKEKLEYFKPELLNKLNSNNDILYLNAICDNPYDVSSIFLLQNKTKEILEILDELRIEGHFTKVILLLKESDTESITALESNLGTYPFIFLHLLPPIYPIGDINVLKENYPIDGVVLNPDEAYSLYKAVFLNEAMTERYITITGEIKNPQVILVKIGTSLLEVLKELKIAKYYGKLDKILSEPINGKEIILKEDNSCWFVCDKDKEKERKCISCGKCIECCPRNCKPIFNDYKNCISCGLCSYVCPSYIHLGGKQNEKNSL